jgi:hypothetical protein
VHKKYINCSASCCHWSPMQWPSASKMLWLCGHFTHGQSHYNGIPVSRATCLYHVICIFAPLYLQWHQFQDAIDNGNIPHSL